jgi:hypothetical protein
MTLEKRLSYVRALTKIQIGLTVACWMIVILLSIAVGVSVLREEAVVDAWIPFLGIAGVILTFVFVVGVALPWIVLKALQKRNESWAIAAMVSLIVQVVCGGGLLSIFPLVTLILLLNKEASTYIGLK